jgi:hypothetical protein
VFQLQSLYCCRCIHECILMFACICACVMPKSWYMYIDIAQATEKDKALSPKDQALANSCIIGIIFNDGFAGRSMAFETTYNPQALTLDSGHTELETNIGTLAHA